MDILTTVFGTQNHLSVGQECARAAVVFVYGLALIRISGRRIFGKWSALDVIVSVTAGSALSRALTGNAALGGTFAATAVLIGLHWLLSKLAAHSPRISKAVEGRSVALAENGRMNEQARLRHSVSLTDLAEALHRKSLDEVDQTHRITLEPNGGIIATPSANQRRDQ